MHNGTFMVISKEIFMGEIGKFVGGFTHVRAYRYGSNY